MKVIKKALVTDDEVSFKYDILYILFITIWINQYLFNKLTKLIFFLIK